VACIIPANEAAGADFGTRRAITPLLAISAVIERCELQSHWIEATRMILDPPELGTDRLCSQIGHRERHSLGLQGHSRPGSNLSTCRCSAGGAAQSAAAFRKMNCHSTTTGWKCWSQSPLAGLKELEGRMASPWPAKSHSTMRMHVGLQSQREFGICRRHRPRLD
jgi:hypothetical protein